MHDTIKKRPTLQVRTQLIEHQDLGEAGNVPLRIPDGEYLMGFVRCERGHVQNRERLFLWFRIVTPGDYFGVELYHHCACPSKGGTKFGLGSNLMRAATIALGQRPKRRDRLNTRMFAGKVFRVRTRTVVKDFKGQPRPQVDHYSVIEELLAREAGWTG